LEKVIIESNENNQVISLDEQAELIINNTKNVEEKLPTFLYGRILNCVSYP